MAMAHALKQRGMMMAADDHPSTASTELEAGTDRGATSRDSALEDGGSTLTGGTGGTGGGGGGGRTGSANRAGRRGPGGGAKRSVLSFFNLSDDGFEPKFRDVALRSHRWRRVIRWMYSSRALMWLRIALTLIALFLHDFTVLALPKEADTPVAVILACVFALFGVEILTQLALRRNYAFTFICGLDLIGLGSLLLDLPTLWGGWQDDGLSYDSDAGYGSGASIVHIMSILRVPQYARMFRVLRLVRVVSIFKFCSYRTAATGQCALLMPLGMPDSLGVDGVSGFSGTAVGSNDLTFLDPELLGSGWTGAGAPPDPRSASQSGGGGRVGLHLSSLIDKRVILMLLVAFVLVPFLQPAPTVDRAALLGLQALEAGVADRTAAGFVATSALIQGYYGQDSDTPLVYFACTGAPPFVDQPDTSLRHIEMEEVRSASCVARISLRHFVLWQSAFSMLLTFSLLFCYALSSWSIHRHVHVLIVAPLERMTSIVRKLAGTVLFLDPASSGGGGGQSRGGPSDNYGATGGGGCIGDSQVGESHLGTYGVPDSSRGDPSGSAAAAAAAAAASSSSSSSAGSSMDFSHLGGGGGDTLLNGAGGVGGGGSYETHVIEAIIEKLTHIFQVQPGTSSGGSLGNNSKGISMLAGSKSTEIRTADSIVSIEVVERPRMPSISMAEVMALTAPLVQEGEEGGGGGGGGGHLGSSTTNPTAASTSSYASSAANSPVLIDTDSDLFKELASVDSILAHPLACAYFKLYLQHSLLVENLSFHSEVDRFKDIMRTHALRLYGGFISTKSAGLSEINVSSAVRERVHHRLERPTLDMFDEAQQECLGLLRSHHGLFLASRFAQGYAKVKVRQRGGRRATGSNNAAATAKLLAAANAQKAIMQPASVATPPSNSSTNRKLLAAGSQGNAAASRSQANVEMVSSQATSSTDSARRKLTAPLPQAQQPQLPGSANPDPTDRASTLAPHAGPTRMVVTPPPDACPSDNNSAPSPTVPWDELDVETHNLVRPGWESEALTNPVAFHRQVGSSASLRRAAAATTAVRKDTHDSNVTVSNEHAMVVPRILINAADGTTTALNSPTMSGAAGGTTAAADENSIMLLRATPTPTPLSPLTSARLSTARGGGGGGGGALAGGVSFSQPSQLHHTSHQAPVEAAPDLTEDEWRLMYPNEPVPSVVKASSHSNSRRTTPLAPSSRPSSAAPNAAAAAAVPSSVTPPSAPTSPSKGERSMLGVPTTSAHGRPRAPSTSQLSAAEVEAESLKFMLPGGGRSGAAHTGDRDIDDEIDRLVNPGAEMAKLISPGSQTGAAAAASSRVPPPSLGLQITKPTNTGSVGGSQSAQVSPVAGHKPPIATGNTKRHTFSPPSAAHPTPMVAFAPSTTATSAASAAVTSGAAGARRNARPSPGAAAGASMLAPSTGQRSSPHASPSLSPSPSPSPPRVHPSRPSPPPTAGGSRAPSRMGVGTGAAIMAAKP